MTGKKPQLHIATEIERKLDVEEGFALPDLAAPGPGVPDGARVVPAAAADLEATYFDSSDLRLLRQAITLRRRTGGSDAGWHLKRPRSDGEREEIRLPPGRSARTVPVALRRQVAVHLRGTALEPVVWLSTLRRAHHVLGPDGTVLAEIADDTVTAERPGQPARSWREVEVELLGGDQELLARLVARLVAAGARPSSSRSKLGRAFGDPPRAARPSRPAGLGRRSAGGVILGYLGTHVEALVRYDPLVRVDAEDSVHRMRVACRRLRSALATYRALFDPDRVDALRGELRHLGDVLGAARDTEVIRDYVLALVAAEPAALVHGPVRRRITTELRERARTGRAAALAELDSGRYFALLDALDAFLADPGPTPAAGERAVAVLPGLVRRSHRRTARSVRAAARTLGPAEREPALHQVRKAAKRARYAAEAAEPALGAPAARLAARLEAVQSVLGTHQDGVVVRDVLLVLAARAHGAGESTFTYGRLHALLQQRAERTEEALAAAWWEASRPKHLRRLG